MSVTVPIYGFGGGGGASLNFQMVGGTTAPSSPKENMIWVNTDQKITSWIFSATEPENPVEGMVWILTGTSSTVEMNALKKNGIQVYPLSAKQYVVGAWVDKEAKSYQNGAWVGWIKFLYNKGSYYVDFAETGYSGGKVIEGSTSFTLYPMSQRVTKYTKEPYNLTDISKIHVHVVRAIGRDNGTNSQLLRVGTLKVEYGWAIGTVAAGKGSNITGQDFELTLDVSALDGMHYIGLSCDSNENDTCMEVDEIRLE